MEDNKKAGGKVGKALNNVLFEVPEGPAEQPAAAAPVAVSRVKNSGSPTSIRISSEKLEYIDNKIRAMRMETGDNPTRNSLIIEMIDYYIENHQ